MIDNSIGYRRVSDAPIVSPSAWDDYLVFGCVPFRIGNILHVLYGGATNEGPNPRLEKEVGLATFDSASWVKQGRVIAKSAVAPANGFAPFSILEIDGVWHLFGAVFQVAAPVYRCAYFTSTDLMNWSGPTYMSGLTPQSHSPCVIEDPSDSEKLILYFTKMDDFLLFRATANKCDPSSWSDLSQASTFQAIYPNVRFVNGRYEAVFSKKIAGTPTRYRSFFSRSRDGLTFMDTSAPVITNGGAGEFDQNYLTTPFLFEDMLFWSGRPAGAFGYKGIGCAELDTVGGVLCWDWTIGGVAKSDLARTGEFGTRIVGAGTLNVHGERDKIYEVWVYDDLNATVQSQATLRMVPEADDISVPQLTLGFVRSVSATKYVYRLRNGAWTETAVNRSAGWHRLTLEVGDDVVLKLDGAVLATDTAIDTDAPFTVSCVGGASGTAYFDDFGVSNL